MNIYLIGFRGTGKSTVAPMVANLLGAQWNALDLDEELQRQAGKSIAEIFADGGELMFRDLESQQLDRVARRDRVVAATGGGVILRPGNRKLLRAGWCVWLQASAEVAHRRIEADASTRESRPNLTTVGGRQEIETLMRTRSPLYLELAQLTLDTDAAGPKEVARRIADEWMQEHTKPVDQGAR